ncbi:MAG: response regulator transcription factor [Verrucomicrobiota bacterium]
MKKILIVEDDERIARALEVRIRNAGYETAVAVDGYTGVSVAIKTRPDLVLLDIHMPAGDGFKVAERLRANGGSRPPIIFITASRKPELFDRALAMGASGFIEKPYDPARVLALVENVLKLRDSMAPRSPGAPLAAG